MSKYYRVIKDNPLWKKGAILKLESKGYAPIEDIWDRLGKYQGDEYLSQQFIESPENAEFFERVYEDTLVGKVFKTKDQIVEAYSKSFKK